MLYDAARTEFALEVYNEDYFVSQIDIFQEYEEIKAYAKRFKSELSEGERIVIKQIFYDKPNEYGDEYQLGVEIVKGWDDEEEENMC